MLARDLSSVQNHDFLGCLLPPEEHGTWKRVLFGPTNAAIDPQPLDNIRIHTLGELLSQPDYIVPLFPVLFVAPLGKYPEPHWLAGV